MSGGLMLEENAHDDGYGGPSTGRVSGRKRKSIWRYLVQRGVMDDEAELLCDAYEEGAEEYVCALAYWLPAMFERYRALKDVTEVFKIDHPFLSVLMPDERVKVEALVYAKKAIGHMASRTTAETHYKQVAVRPLVGVVPEMDVRASASRVKPIETQPVRGPIAHRGAGGLVEREGMATPHRQKGPKATKSTAQGGVAKASLWWPVKWLVGGCIMTPTHID
ncbi:unnamed protein product [Vitrella brassicaformis CCMP3155]|uniref:Uncharacterized protein n=1 Tax=Vitrella brassicaformis (strain CCMP3155) TaxID=1169540 RepID=A0A0G4GZK9_VITBC|nr:unnamed protein product [Vitrella brassicaformis CCMP3155]|eukprot:CEM36651.1 unnamed protein product [Vitrella brassicaformis CCMP3155]